MNNKARMEGGWDSKIVKLMRDTGYNKDSDIELGVVKSAPPNIRISLDGVTFDLDASDLIVAERVSTSLKVGDRVIVASANNGQRYFVLDKAVTY